MALWAIGILFPLLWIVFESLKTNREFFADIWSIPEKLKWVNYANAWTLLGVKQSMFNTLYYIGLSLLIGMFFTTVNAYALTRLDFRGRKLIWAMIMLSLFLPGINALVPQYVLMRSFSLTNSLTGLVILDSLGESALYLMLLGGFMASLPKEVEESAYVDGASLFKVFYKIIVPLSIPGIVTVAIFKFMGLYNNFLGPLIYLSDPRKYTIGLNIYYLNILMQYKTNWVTLFASVIITLIPLVFVYVLFQRQIMEGTTIGAVKG
ncbi:carbohydrate ABC transporter permease [Cohnella sp. NL03-T5]|nr:carbohydrate ABC transporter permease [Cohnella silvisoli]